MGANKKNFKILNFSVEKFSTLSKKSEQNCFKTLFYQIYFTILLILSTISKFIFNYIFHISIKTIYASFT